MKPLIIANWKMNPQTLTEARILFNSVKRGISKMKNVEAVICPPSIYLADLGRRLPAYLRLGAQNCHWIEAGAFTGEVSPAMIKDAGCQHIIIGHSERRIYFGETDEMINKKLAAALKDNLKPIFCVGENLEEKERNITQEVLKRQLEIGLNGIVGHYMRDIVIAYEPVWAISGFGGSAADCNEIMTCNLLIRKIIGKIYNQKIARDLRIIYGGSVNSKNAGDFMACSAFDGLLVGGASLNATEFINIIKNITHRQSG